MTINLFRLTFIFVILNMLNGCVINQTSSDPYPDEKLQHMLGMSKDDVFARLGPPDRSVEGDYGLVYTWMANYTGIGSASAVVHNSNCQFHFIFNTEMKVSKIDMTGDPHVCNHFIRINKKSFAVN